MIQGLLQFRDLLSRQDVLAQQAHLHARNRIAHGIGFTLRCGTVELVVIGKRMRVRPDHVPMHESRSLARAAMFHRCLEGAQAGLGVGAVDLLKVEIGKVRHQREMLPPGVFTSTGTLMA